MHVGSIFFVAIRTFRHLKMASVNTNQLQFSEARKVNAMSGLGSLLYGENRTPG